MKLISVQDISCYGQCSLTVALPILSYFGIETVILPSAILSTHTGGFTDFVVQDLTSLMPKIVSHWISEEIKADAIYTGYIGSSEQFDIILDMKDKMLKEDGLFFVDPAMADHGKMYYGLGIDIVKGMRRMCSLADYILPNITEACFLTDTPYTEDLSDDYIDLLLSKLYMLGCKNVILTGVEINDSIGAYYYNGEKREGILFPKEEKSYHGTGDIFTSVVIGELCSGRSINDSIKAAASFVIDSIKKTKNDSSHNYGVKFEEVLREKRY